MKSYTPPIYLHTTDLADPATAVIERSAEAGGHEVRAHVRQDEVLALADLLAARAERHDDFRREFHGFDDVSRPWHVVLQVWP